VCPFDARIYEGEGRFYDLDLGAIRWLRDAMSAHNPGRSFAKDPEAFLREICLLQQEGLTNAAVLLFGQAKILAPLKAEIVDFRVIDDSAEPETCGHVIAVIRSLMHRFHRLWPQPFDVKPAGVQGRYRPLSTDYLAVREALLNLLIHQDYADQHHVAKILWYDDRIVFDNPGNSWVERANLVQGGFTSLRNPLLARMMRLAGFVEAIGRGVSGIVKVWKAAGRAEPEVVNDIGYGSYRLILPVGETSRI
jgi:ATP-dependent DNA helicase RecG